MRSEQRVIWTFPCTRDWLFSSKSKEAHLVVARLSFPLISPFVWKELPTLVFATLATYFPTLSFYIDLALCKIFHRGLTSPLEVNNHNIAALVPRKRSHHGNMTDMPQSNPSHQEDASLSGFERLATELRLEIYKYHFLSLDLDALTCPPPAITRVCRLTRHESLSLFYEYAKLHVQYVVGPPSIAVRKAWIRMFCRPRLTARARPCQAFASP